MIRIAAGLLLMFAVLYAGIYFLDIIGVLDIPRGQYSASATQIVKSPVETKESIFKPVQIEWEGKIFAVLQSGNGYAIKSSDEKAKYPEFMAFWPGDKMEWLDGNVRIKGLSEGIDCAYQNTIFGGKCVPLVTITSLKVIEE